MAVEDKEKKHELNDQFYTGNVEEAVLRIVGSTLDDDSKKRMDPFGAYINQNGWDILDHNYLDFSHANTRKKKKLEHTNVDPQLSQVYGLRPPVAPRISAHHPHHGNRPTTVQPAVGPGGPQVHAAAAAAAVNQWESESGGVFTEGEVKALDQFMDNYAAQHKMSREQVCDRVWSSDRKKDSFWDSVTAALPHRTRASVYKHVRRTYHNFQVRARWMPSDDQKLRTLYEEKGAQWKVIGRLMERMPEDCRDRYRNYVKCGEQRNENKWSLEEEAMLKEAVAIVKSTSNPNAPINWGKVSEHMAGTRSRIQCRYKWRKLTRSSAS